MYRCHENGTLNRAGRSIFASYKKRIGTFITRLAGYEYIVILCLFSCPAFFIDAATQEMTHFVEKLTAEDGLSSNKVNDIVHDQAGIACWPGRALEESNR
jgi:hypothetical protein